MTPIEELRDISTALFILFLMGWAMAVSLFIALIQTMAERDDYRRKYNRLKSHQALRVQPRSKR